MTLLKSLKGDKADKAQVECGGMCLEMKQAVNSKLISTEKGKVMYLSGDSNRVIHLIATLKVNHP